MARIAPDSHVTLHYRLAALIDGAERQVFSTLGGHPATLQLGGGHLAAGLESRLLGLAEGDETSFDLGPAEAFGERSAELVQVLSRSVFEANAEAAATYAPGDLISFNRPDGGRVAGVLKACDERRVVVDFNHPLAGTALRFSVRVLGVL